MYGPITTLTRIEVRILRFFEERGGTWKSRDLSRELDLERRHMARGLTWLAEAGALERVSHGRYRLSEGAS